MTPLAAVRFLDPTGDVRVGRLDAGVVVDAGPAGPAGFVPDDAGWAAVEAAAGTARPVEEVRLLEPVRPGKILCVGTNYADHAAESDADVPPIPVLFAKLPSSVIGPGDPIVLPFDEPWPDFEAEVALVIGRTLRRGDRDRARSAIGGVTAFNDVSGRAAQFADPGRQFTRGKSFDTFGPLGPAIVRAADVDLADLEVRCVLSGEEMQQASTSLLIHDAEAVVSFCAGAFTLLPGDLIATGTPGGVGHVRTPPRHLRAGDVVEVHVSHVGILRNPVVAEPRP